MIIGKERKWLTLKSVAFSCLNCKFDNSFKIIFAQVPDDRRHESADCDPDRAHPGPGPAARDTDPASAAGQHPLNLGTFYLKLCFFFHQPFFNKAKEKKVENSSKQHEIKRTKKTVEKRWIKEKMLQSSRHTSHDSMLKKSLSCH
mgnify:CR=1 FL=1